LRKEETDRRDEDLEQLKKKKIQKL